MDVNCKKPNFFLVGASKAGTTAIAEALGTHSLVFMSSPKEPDFFNCFDDVSGSVEKQKIEQYLSIFNKVTTESIVGEASVSYLSSKLAAKHIFDFSPDAKIIISLRNPLERIKSLYEMYKRLGLKDSFNDVVISDPWLVRQCYYTDMVKRYYELFPKSQVFILDYRDLKSDWGKAMGEIQCFLALPQEIVESPIVRNLGGVPKRPIFNIFLNRKLISFGKKILPKKIHNFADRYLKKVAFKRVEISQSNDKYLINIFSPDVKSLDQLLGTDYLSGWLSEK